MERPLVAVGCVIVQDERVLLVRRKKPPNQGLLAIPGGKVEYGETLEQAAMREMLEETGLLATPKRVMAIVDLIREGFHYVIIDFLCDLKGGVPKAGSDASEIVWLSKGELTRLGMSPSTYEMLKRYFNGEELPIRITAKE